MERNSLPPEPWKPGANRLSYQNPWWKMGEDILRMPNERTTVYGRLECGEVVGVLPFLDDHHVVLVRRGQPFFGEQPRWEIPSGGVKLGEALEDAALRELEEQAGYQAYELQPINIFFSSKSVVQEQAHLFVGRQIKPIQTMPGEARYLEVAVFPFEQVVDWALNSEVRDAITLVAVLRAARMYGV